MIRKRLIAQAAIGTTALLLPVLTGCGGGAGGDISSDSTSALHRHRDAGSAPALDSGTTTAARDSATAPPLDGAATLLGLSFSATAGTISAPFQLSNGALSQDITSANIDGTNGSAVYTFAVPTTGQYLLTAIVDAPNTGENSFFINVDSQPTSPANLWDITPNSGFANDVISWRGSSLVTDVDHSPQVFSLTAGEHRLILLGREGGTQVQQFTFAPQPLSADAGTADSASPDSGRPDSGPADSGSPDTGTADSGPASTTGTGHSYYVTVPGGSDANAGDSAHPWLTLTKSIPKLSAGDTLIMSGTFLEPMPCAYGCGLTFNVSGTATSPITLNGQGATIELQNGSQIGNFLFTGDYLVFDGLEITTAAPVELAGGFGFQGSHNTIKNWTLHDMAGSVATAANGIGGGDHLMLIINQGDYNTFSNITFRNIQDADLYRVWGHDNLITHTTATHCTNPNYNANGITQLHADLIQFWGCAIDYNNIFENSLVMNSSISGGMLASESDAAGNPTCPNMNDWVYRNNIFANNGSEAVMCAADHMHFYNNLFYDWPGGLNFFYANEFGNQIADNNVFIASSIGDAYGEPPMLTINDNAWDATAERDSTDDMRTLFAGSFLITDPGFVNAAAGDFHLLSTSVLRGKGMNLSSDMYASSTDTDGNVRPASGGWDLGPYQYVGP